MKWLVILNDYKTGETEILGTYRSKYQALESAELYAKDFIVEREGSKDDFKVWHSSEHNRPFGYFCQSSSRLSNSINVKRKSLCGWVFSSVLVETFFKLTCVPYNDMKSRRLQEQETKYASKLEDLYLDRKSNSRLIDEIHETVEFVRPMPELAESEQNIFDSEESEEFSDSDELEE